jgi:hypothetical protein
MDYVEVQPDKASMDRLAAALEHEATGREWNSEFDAAMRDALSPAVNAVRSAVLSRSGGGVPHAGQSLRQAIAGGVKIQPLRAGSPGARIAATGSGMPRGFRKAPKRFNERKFRHPVFGGDQWVNQIGAPGWFDDTLDRFRPRLVVLANKSLDARAERISREGPR